MDPHQLLPLLILVLMKSLAISETTATAILISQDICAVAGGIATITCDWNGATSGKQLNFYHLIGEDFKDIGPDINASKYHTAKNITLCDESENGQVYRHKRVALEIRDVSLRDEGTYACGTGPFDVKETTVKILQDAEFKLSIERPNLNRSQEFSVKPTAGCNLEGTIRVEKTDGSGMRTTVRYGNGLGQEPYIRSRDGFLIFPTFTCEDEGDYEFTYTTQKGHQPVDTKRTMYIEGESCNKKVTEIPPSSSPQKNQRIASEEPDHENGYHIAAVVILAVACGILCFACVILCFACVILYHHSKSVRY